jgi:phosphofructokinase-like protein
MSKRIGIFTSGGDCPGLNAVMRAVVHRADLVGWDVIGIEDGAAGLLRTPPTTRRLYPEDFDCNVMRRGGTIMGTTNKRDPFAYKMEDGTLKDRSGDLIPTVKDIGLDALIGIGGDGSLAIWNRLAKQGGLNFIGIPKTIDNDLDKTDVSVGFDTAVMVATEALDRLQPTAASHDRVMILEVMGRDAGHIALATGIAGAADVILIPEIPYNIDKIAHKLMQVKDTGRNFALMVVSEAVKAADGMDIMVDHVDGQKRYGGIGEYLAPHIFEATGFETRVTVLGHVQRGARPTWNDRMLAQALGVKAVDMVEAGQFGHMVAWQNRSAVPVPIEDAVQHCRTVRLNGTMMHTARSLGISFGD